MATTIKTNRSIIATNEPTNLAQGELSVNIADQKMWVGDGTINPVPLIGPESPWTPAAGIPEAPEDGQQYGRQNASWTVVDTGGGSGVLPDSTALNNSLRADNSGGWVENSYVKILSDGIAMGGTSNNWASLAVMNGANVPS